MSRIEVKRSLLEWAIERSGMPLGYFSKRWPKVENWLDGSGAPTVKQLQEFAKATYTPFGYFFLSTPPKDEIPVPDYRVIAGQPQSRPSPNLLDTIYTCQQRQEWYRDFLRAEGETPLPFVGKATLNDSVVEVAAEIREKLGFKLEAQTHSKTWMDTLRTFIAAADELGILVMTSGIVGNNTHRKLEPSEFRGFALSDEYAPLIFINGADTKSAQMFTLAHELAHVWLGESALSDAQADSVLSNNIEKWCNQVAAEFLVPIAVMRTEFDTKREISEEMTRLSRRFKVSTLVILRRIFDLGGMTRGDFENIYQQELERLLAITKRSGGGDFYLTQGARLGKRFARAVIINTMEGHTLHRDAFHMLGFSKISTFEELGAQLGVV